MRHHDCPICLQPLQGQDWYEEPAGLVESFWHCPTCELTREFTYGASRWSIGRQDWIWVYSDDWETVYALQQECAALADLFHSEYHAMLSERHSTYA
ncbi:MAG TPA: hypothetical protein VF077_12390 [Nitrospiraceae bacterium]